MWPNTIPEDLRISIEEHGQSEWLEAFKPWAREHGLKIKLQWISELERAMAELDSWRWPPKAQDRWIPIKEMLERNGVEAPKALPLRSDDRVWTGH